MALGGVFKPDNLESFRMCSMVLEAISKLLHENISGYAWNVGSTQKMLSAGRKNLLEL